MNYVVGLYELDRQYGGPEEGGWWYDSGELVRIMAVTHGAEKASQLCRRANHLLRFVQRSLRYKSDSICYRGGEYGAYVYENVAPSYYPEQRPHYE